MGGVGRGGGCGSEVSARRPAGPSRAGPGRASSGRVWAGPGRTHRRLSAARRPHGADKGGAGGGGGGAGTKAAAAGPGRAGAAAAAAARGGRGPAAGTPLAALLAAAALARPRRREGGWGGGAAPPGGASRRGVVSGKGRTRAPSPPHAWGWAAPADTMGQENPHTPPPQPGGDACTQLDPSQPDAVTRGLTEPPLQSTAPPPAEPPQAPHAHPCLSFPPAAAPPAWGEGQLHPMSGYPWSGGRGGGGAAWGLP